VSVAALRRGPHRPAQRMISLPSFFACFQALHKYHLFRKVLGEQIVSYLMQEFFTIQ
jgi:hypothetical protein